MTNERGAALVVAMWLVALGSILAFNYSRATRLDTLSIGATIAQYQARAAAEAGIWRAVYEISDPHPDDPLAADGSTFEFDLNGAAVSVNIQDVSGLADLNRANASTLVQLITYALDDPARAAVIVERVVDWRDKDQRAGLNGAEAGDYAAAGYDYAPKDGPFSTREELQLLLNLSAEEYRKIAPFVTVFSMKKNVSSRVAPVYVLDALEQNASATQTAQADSGQANSAARQGSFELLAEAKMNGSVSRISAIVTINSRARKRVPVTILAWRESWPFEPPHTAEDNLEPAQ